MSSARPWSRLSSIRWPTIAAMSSLLIVRSDGRTDAHPVGDGAELLVQLVAADAAQVIATEVEEQALDELLGVVARGRIAGAQLLVDLDQRLAASVGAVLLERRGDVRRVAGVDAREERDHLVVRLPAHGTQQLGRLELALAVDLDVQLAARGGLELEPRTAVGDDLGVEQVAAGGRVLDRGVVDTRRADELADHDALGAVDDERAFLGHEREVAHVHALALDLAGLLDEQLDPDVERLGEGQVTRAALELVVLGSLELVLAEAQLHHSPGEVLDRADLVEQLAQPVLDEPVERIELQLDQIRDRQDFGNPCVWLTLSRGSNHTSAGIGDSQHQALLATRRRDDGRNKSRGQTHPSRGVLKDKGTRAQRPHIVPTLRCAVKRAIYAGSLFGQAT